MPTLHCILKKGIPELFWQGQFNRFGNVPSLFHASVGTYRRCSSLIKQNVCDVLRGNILYVFKALVRFKRVCRFPSCSCKIERTSTPDTESFPHACSSDRLAQRKWKALSAWERMQIPSDESYFNQTQTAPEPSCLIKEQTIGWRWSLLMKLVLFDFLLFLPRSYKAWGDNSVYDEVTHSGIKLQFHLAELHSKSV